MLRRLGIETSLQLTITVCVMALIIVTTLGGSGGAPWVFFTYRTLLIVIAVLSTIGTRREDARISGVFLACVGVLFALMLISVLRIPGSNFEGFYLWFKYAFFACAFVSLANYARYQSAAWKGLLLGTIIAVNLAHLLPDLLLLKSRVAGFSQNNPNYFATFLLIGLAASIAAAVFGMVPKWRVAAAIPAPLLLFGIVKTGSRGAVLGVAAMLVVVAVRARGRIPRRVWFAVGVVAILTAAISSPFLITKFFDRGEIDPYNYARTEIWRGSLQVVTHYPLLGVGFGQFFHISKRFTLPIEGRVARYMKRSQIAHNEYLQHAAELGIPAALLLFSLLGYMLYLVVKRVDRVWPEYVCFHEAALITAAGIGTHALVDNCWTIPVTASALVVLALADPLPLRKKEAAHRWRVPQMAFAGAMVAVVYVFSTVIPGLGIYYNEEGHKAYDRNDFASAERLHLAAITIVPNHPLFLDNLGMVYLQQAMEKKDAKFFDLARRYFARAIHASPQSLDPHVHMETVLTKMVTGDPAADREVYRDIIKNDTELLEIDPFVPFPRKNLAGAYYNLGEWDHAMQELKRAIDYEPNYVPGYLQMATWYGEHGDPAASQRYTTVAVEIINKYRNFKPTEPYEGVLLGRPPESYMTQTGQMR